MKIIEYLRKYNMRNEEFAVRCGVCHASVHRWKLGKSISQEKAELIEKKTGGEVTVMDLRGKDNRIKKKEKPSDERAYTSPFKPYN